MKYYKFKTFTTSYYFPKEAKSKPFLYGLYSAYGGVLSRLYWYLFRHCIILRSFFQVKVSNQEFCYDLIKSLVGSDSVMSFNMGSPGMEQKISILGYDSKQDLSFFAKFSQKPMAMDLTINEILIYNILKDRNLTPRLLDSKITDEYVFLKAEYIKGARPASSLVSSKIVDLSLELSSYHLTSSYIDDNGLRTSLSHGDFCPWNILEDNEKMRLIDWEMAKDRVLGFDLFTYICQVSALFYPNINFTLAINTNKHWIKKYFKSVGINDYTPYLYSFASEKFLYEKSKGNLVLADKYNELL